MDLPGLGFAFTAGLLAFLSPCALPMFPSYISYYLNLDEDTNKLGSSLIFSLSTVVGFMMVYALLGLLPTFAINVVSFSSTIFVPIIGATLVLMGVLTGWSDKLENIPVFNLKLPESSGVKSFIIYGFGYGFASLGCSFPVFLLLISQTSTASNLMGVFQIFLVYGLGAATLIVPLTLALAYSKNQLYNSMVSVMPYMKKINAMVLIVAGLYMIFYFPRII
jgi:cytochrome c-type biogenesis protein